MRNVLIISWKETKSYFTSPIAWVVCAIFIVISSWFFVNIVTFFVLQSIQALRYPWLAERINIQDMIIRPFYGNLSIILLLMVPALTMRLFSEEKKMGTFELLYTSPITVWQMVLGKYLASVVFLVFMLLLTALYPVFLFAYGQPELGPVLSTYLGIFLMGASFCAVGLLASSMTENQVIAAVLAFGVLLLFWVLGWASQSVGEPLKFVLQFMSFLEHHLNFSKGIIDTRDVIYYISFVAFVLFLAHGVLESRRWRGLA
jgi:ABC-2 type transport system permease protein